MMAIALSGGVDSAVAAALYKKQGVDLIGVTMQMQETDDLSDAERVAQTLGIPLHIIDVREPFARLVKEDFAATYARGETPVPCATCNRRIKFGELAQAAHALGAQALITGHYALLKQRPSGIELHKATDTTKDQSYFLFALTQEQIDFARFPLGEMTKSETRALAEQWGLPVAQKKDSQDICFVPGGDYVQVLEKLKPDARCPGEIVDETGQVLGRHNGIITFTIGQRKGLNLSDRIGDNNAPLFVLRLDAQKRQVIVGPRESLRQNKVVVRDLNWLPTAPPDAIIDVSVRLRSAQQPMDAVFDKEALTLTLKEPTFGVAPGQAAVMYKDTQLLGGGWITK